MPRESSSTVKVRYLDGPYVIAELKKVAQGLLEENPLICRVLLFGSLVRGDYSPGSDADIMIILARDERRIMDRIPQFLKPFLAAPIPVDVFPYTRKEIDKMLSADNFFIRRALNESLVLAER